MAYVIDFGASTSGFEARLCHLIFYLGTGRGGPEHLEMWLIKKHDLPPPFGTKMTDPPLKQGWKLHDPPPS